MNFVDFSFWPVLLTGVALIAVVRTLARAIGHPISDSGDKWALAVLSLTLLAGVNFLTFSIFAALATLTFITLCVLARTRNRFRPWLLLTAIPLLLAPLAYYKYRTFFVEQVLGWETVTLDAIAIPAGISFYTFQMIGMLIDASRLDGYRPKLVNFLNFASFFPQVVAGPIERKSSLMPQIETFRFAISRSNLDEGAPWVALGFFYKICLADNLSPFIDRDAMESAWPILWTTFLFGLKIYFDFCGYSLIALGIARWFGIRLTLNFQSPYLSTNIRDFWRRWHVSLSYWFRDYIYIPLGGSREKLWPVNLMLVFLISGLWHGAGWGFLIWGALHGIYCVASHLLKERLPVHPLIGWGATTFLVFAAWLPFYETRLDVLAAKSAILLNPTFYSWDSLVEFVAGIGPLQFLPMGATVLMCAGAVAFEFFSRRSGGDYCLAASPVAVAILVAMTVWLGSSRGNDFVYFSF